LALLIACVGDAFWDRRSSAAGMTTDPKSKPMVVLGTGPEPTGRTRFPPLKQSGIRQWPLLVANVQAKFDGP
jgi:hypothetical protein